MKKVLALTVVMVLAFASMAFAEVKVGGEVGFSVDYKIVEDKDGNEQASEYTADLGDVYVTVTASEEGKFEGYVKVQADSDDDTAYLDEYSLKIYDELFTVEAWGNDAEETGYSTPLAFIEAPSDANTVRFTTTVLGPELVADFSDEGDPDRYIRLFGKYALDGITIGGATEWNDGNEERNYVVFATTDLSGVTLSGEVLYDSTKDDNNKKYGLLAKTTVSDFGLTGKVVRDTSADNEDDNYTELYGALAYKVAGVPYGFSVSVDNKRYEADDVKGTKVVLSGDYNVVPDFLTVNAGFTRIDQEGRRTSGKSPFTVEDVKNWQDSDGDDDLWTDFLGFDKYNKVELGATIAVTKKLSVEPSVSYQKFENVTRVNDAKVNSTTISGKLTTPEDEVVYKDFAVDTTYAITENTSVTYSLTKRINERGGLDLDGLYHSLGVSVKF